MNHFKPLILVVDDEIKSQEILIDILKYKGYSVQGVSTGQDALAFVETNEIDLVFLDLKLPDIDGTKVLDCIKQQSPLTPVVIISAYGDIPTAVRTTQLGATAFLEKPLDSREILTTVEKILGSSKSDRDGELKKDGLFQRYGMIGTSPPILKIYDTIDHAAPTDAAVLIEGETGTGKELVAKAIHNFSPRKGNPFVKVNCAAIPNDLIESELFGHKKGAFTGAMFDKKGKFQLADTGTLFLDEIADMNPLTQSKVLRAIQENEVETIGGDGPIKVSLRIIAASNKNLKEQVKSGYFREDLFFRLNVINMRLPTLKERREDIPYLLDHYLKKYCEDYNRRQKRLSHAALEILLNRDWPGNIRELVNVVQKIVILFDDDLIEERHLFSVFQQQEFEQNLSANLSLREAKENFEREYIYNKLIINKFSMQKTADELCIERTNLYRKIKQLGIKVPDAY